MSSSDDEKTPLERAMEKGRVLELECFLKAGIDPNLRDSKENSLLYNAVKNNSVNLREKSSQPKFFRHPKGPLL